MNERTQRFQRRKDCKHSVVYEPTGLGKDEPEIASAIYISRAILGQPVPDVVVVSIRPAQAIEPLKELAS